MRTVLPLLLLVASSAFAQQPPRQWKTADPAVDCADAQDKTLCAQLLALRDRDQLARYDALNKGDNPDANDAVARVDAQNLAELEPILTKHGYPGKTLVGAKASGAAWTVIQHNSLEVQKKYIGLMTKAADAGELNGALLATTIDRIAMREKRPQTYGTQFHEVNGELVPWTIEDEANVDARRASVGLPPLAEYTKLMRQMYKKN